jgi:large exoprotein involved in heme utilization and adhesion
MAGFSGGSINIIAHDRDMKISGGGSITVDTQGAGKAGDISLAARNINLDQGIKISAKTLGKGPGGNINLNANIIILDNGAEVSTSSGKIESPQPTGPAGSISITATGPNSLHLRNGSKISSATSSTKDWTNPTDLANIIINTPHLSMEGGSSINASTSNVASGGGITLYSPWVELAGGSKITTASTGSGAGGNININGTRLQLSNKSEISAAGENNGQAGSINLNLRDQLQLDNGSKINASTARSTTNDGGANININLGGNLILNNGSSITARATGKANGGNIKLSLPKGFLLSSFPPSFGGNDILASAEEGIGGRIELRALGIFGVNKNTFDTRISEASAKSRSGRNGVLAFYIPYLTPDRGVVPIEQTLDPDNDLVRVCSPRTAGARAAFTQTGRGGLPILPGTRPSSSPLLDDLGRPALRQGRLISSPLPNSSLPSSSQLAPPFTFPIASATQLQDPGRPQALPLPPCPENR